MTWKLRCWSIFRDACNGDRSTSSDRQPRAEAGGIHSNAYNFLSAVSSGVDPRTGMYSCSIRLPGVAANNL